MPSSRGDKFATLRLSNRICSDIGLMLVSLELSGNFYDRSADLKVAEQTQDFWVRLPQIRVERNAIERLNMHFTEWFERRVEFECVLTPEKGSDQFLSFKLGRADGLMYSLEKPALTVVYDCGAAMTSKSSFVIDQSCVRSWLDENPP